MNKKRTIIATVVMFLIIALLIIIIVAVATRKPAGEITKRTASEFSEIAKNGAEKNQNKAEDENLPPVSNSNDSAIVKSEGNESSEKTETSENKTEINTETNGSMFSDQTTIINTEISDVEQTNNSDLPKTGPESALPLALLLGVFATFIASSLVVRDRRLI